MLAKSANVSCSASFLHLTDGRLFRLKNGRSCVVIHLQGDRVFLVM
jgi:hypothetical protein